MRPDSLRTIVMLAMLLAAAAGCTSVGPMRLTGCCRQRGCAPCPPRARVQAVCDRCHPAPPVQTAHYPHRRGGSRGRDHIRISAELASAGWHPTRGRQEQVARAEVRSTGSTPMQAPAAGRPESQVVQTGFKQVDPFAEETAPAPSVVTPQPVQPQPEVQPEFEPAPMIVEEAGVAVVCEEEPGFFGRMHDRLYSGFACWSLADGEANPIHEWFANETYRFRIRNASQSAALHHESFYEPALPQFMPNYGHYQTLWRRFEHEPGYCPPPSPPVVVHPADEGLQHDSGVVPPMPTPAPPAELE